MWQTNEPTNARTEPRNYYIRYNSLSWARSCLPVTTSAGIIQDNSDRALICIFLGWSEPSGRDSAGVINATSHSASEPQHAHYTHDMTPPANIDQSEARNSVPGPMSSQDRFHDQIGPIRGEDLGALTNERVGTLHDVQHGKWEWWWLYPRVHQ